MNRDDDDRHWIAGTIYFNRDDPRILVPKTREASKRLGERMSGTESA